jgi:hypothetical protein
MAVGLNRVDYAGEQGFFAEPALEDTEGLRIP